MISRERDDRVRKRTNGPLQRTMATLLAGVGGSVTPRLELADIHERWEDF
jgi:hypothetical protein